MAILGLLALGLGTIISLHPNTFGDSIAGGVMIILGIGLVVTDRILFNR